MRPRRTPGIPKETPVPSVFATDVLLADVLTNKPVLQATELLSGPMVGHTTTTSAKICIETDVPASVKVQYWLDRQQNYERYLGQPVVKGTAKGGHRAAFPTPEWRN